jgi:hypothetical protein
MLESQECIYRVLTNFMVPIRVGLTAHPPAVGAPRLILRLVQFGKVFDLHEFNFRGFGVAHTLRLLEGVLQHIGWQVVKVFLLVHGLLGLLFRLEVDLLDQVFVVFVHVRLLVVLDSLSELFRVVFRDVRFAVGGENFGGGVCKEKLKRYEN